MARRGCGCCANCRGVISDSTFRRYLIQSHADAAMAMELLDKARAEQAKARMAPAQGGTGPISVPIAQETAVAALPLASNKVQ